MTPDDDALRASKPIQAENYKSRSDWGIIWECINNAEYSNFKS